MIRRSCLALSFFAFSLAGSIVFAEPDVLAPCASAPPTDEARKARYLAIALEGEWRMYLPAGWERTVTIDRLGEGRYYVRPPYVMAGTYVQDGDRLTRVSEERLDDGAKPESELPKNEVFAWLVRSPYMLTLLENSESRSNNYLGATLFRLRETKSSGSAKGADNPSTPSSPNVTEPFGIDIPETELDVRIFPGQQGSRLPDGGIRFEMTVANQSDVPIEFDLPGARGARTSAMARVRLLEPRPQDAGERPHVLANVYRTGADPEDPKVRILPNERVEFDVQLGPNETESNWRLQRLPRTYEIGLSMTFLANGELQVVTGPRGSTVQFASLELFR